MVSEALSDCSPVMCHFACAVRVREEMPMSVFSADKRFVKHAPLPASYNPLTLDDADNDASSPTVINNSGRNDPPENETALAILDRFGLVG